MIHLGAFVRTRGEARPLHLFEILRAVLRTVDGTNTMGQEDTRKGAKERCVQERAR